MPSVSRMSRGTSVAVLPSLRIWSSSSSRPPTVRAVATICAPASASANAVAWPMPREAPVTSAIRSASGFMESGSEAKLDRLGQQRQLSRRDVLAGAVGHRRRISAGEAVIGELRPHWVAPLLAHGTIDAVDREERERVRVDELAHAFDVMVGGEQLVALGRVDAVVVGMRDRRRGDAEMHLLGAGLAH